ncbi:MAG: glycosyltransferase family 2 protein [Terracidiphilus sp.]|jgi:cellulose synthase/poly-beta-1,6-N-acetylglucosamine synthase-like glycosyltransferase
MLASQILFILGLFLVLATLPLLAELMALTGAALAPSARVGKDDGESELPLLTVLVPAHNEEALIARCIRSLRSSTGAGFEVLVIAHNCSDATATEAEAAGARVLELNDPDQRGKGCALSYGFSAAMAGNSQAVLVIDADSVVDSGLITTVQRRFKSGARAVQCRYEVYNSKSSGRTRLMTLAFYAFNIIRPRGRARLGLSAGILGNGFALHRDVLMRIPYIAHSVVEDLEYHLALVRADICVEFIDTDAVRGEMPVTKKSAETQRARWEGGRLRMMKQWAPELMGDVLRGQTRLMEPLLDLVSLPIALEVTLLLVAACLPFLWLRVYVLAAFAVLFAHVFTAALSGPGFWETMRALSTAPAYVLWKLWMLPKIWRTSRANAAWVRTERVAPADGQ